LTIKIKVQPYLDQLKKDWDEVLDNSINGIFLHTREFIEYHKGRFVDASLIIYDNNFPLAIFPAEIDDNFVYSHRGLTYAGWIIRSGLSGNQIFIILKETISFYKIIGKYIQELRTVPEIFCKNSQTSLFENLSKLGAVKYFSAMHHYSPLPIKISNKGKLWGKRKALSAELSIQISNDYQPFWNEILIPNLKKRHQVKPTHSLEEITYLSKSFPENIVLYEVRLNGEILGGAVLFFTDITIHGQYISANEKGRKFKALDYLMAFFLEQRRYSHRFFNMGVSHIPGTNKINKGLQWWKESFGAKPLEQPFLRFEN
jgi:hypothetical protein